MNSKWKPLEYDKELFSKIINHEYAIDLVYEDKLTMAFHWINPVAPIHILIMPKKIIPTLNDVTNSDVSILGELVYVASKIAYDLDLATDGYRLVFNVNEMGGQHIFHIHLHFMAGRKFGWPPG